MKKQLNKILTFLNLILISTIIFMGCDIMQSSNNDLSEVQVRMQLEVLTSSSAAKQMMASNQENGITVEEVKLFIDEMELESVQNDSLDFEFKNFIVNLPLDGSPLLLTEQKVPSGIYNEFELEIEKLDDENIEVFDTDFRDETGSYSLIAKGLYNGEEFTFRSSEDFEIDVDLNPELEISESGSSLLVVSIDVNSWFKDDNGEDVDPKDLQNAERINENIANSFKGFEDMFDEEENDDED